MNPHIARVDSELQPITDRLAAQGAHHVYVALILNQSVFHIKSDLLNSPEYPGILEAMADKLREEAAHARLRGGKLHYAPLIVPGIKS